jgi:hypothetical protein
MTMTTTTTTTTTTTAAAAAAATTTTTATAATATATATATTTATATVISWCGIDSTTASTPALGTTYPHIQWAVGESSCKVALVLPVCTLANKFNVICFDLIWYSNHYALNS